MRFTVLTTGTNNTQTVYNSILRAGHELSIVIYDEMPEHSGLCGVVERTGPDIIVFFGAIEHMHGKPVPRVDQLAAVGELAPMVHLCFDGAEPLWWPQLQKYYDFGKFALQVNIDGVRTGPIGEFGITLLCPIDPEPFGDPPPRATRPVRLGFGGNKHGAARQAILGELTALNVIKYRPRDSDGLGGYVEFLKSCRSAWNFPQTGGGTGSTHVKARTLEAALAGCLLLEQCGSPLEDWFTPGDDFVSYSDAPHVERLLKRIDADPVRYDAVAAHMRQRVLREHNPSAFWKRVLTRLGMSPATEFLYQPPFRPWTRPPEVTNHVSVQHPDQRPHSGPHSQGLYQPPAPILLRAENKVNLVHYNGRVYAVPQRLGNVELDKSLSNPLIVEFTTVEAASEAVRAGNIK